MPFRIGLFAAIPLIVATSLYACGSDEPSGFNEDGGTGASSGASGNAASGGFSSGSGPDGSGGGEGDGGACEAAVARAEKLPVLMLLLLDQSGSMGDHGGPSEHTNRESRWLPITTALSGFLGDPVSAGIEANLRYFPKVSNRQESEPYAIVPANETLNCAKESYATPDVPLTALPNAAAFAFADNATYYGTPTLPAVQATVDEAIGLVTTRPEAKTVVVLVTDGEPSGCAGNTIGNIAAAVSGPLVTFPTYVIGIDDVEGLNTIASAGGTEAAITVPVNGGAAETQAAFTEAIENIRRQALSCEVPIPPAPQGKTFDRDKVNVAVVVGEGRTELGYDPTCAGPGWKYDNEAAPTQIVLCPATCEPAKENPATQIDVAFGCTRRNGPN